MSEGLKIERFEPLDADTADLNTMPTYAECINADQGLGSTRSALDGSGEYTIYEDPEIGFYKVLINKG